MRIDELINKLTDLKTVNGNIDVFIEYDGVACMRLYPEVYSDVKAHNDDISLMPWERKSFPSKFILFRYE